MTGAFLAEANAWPFQICSVVQLPVSVSLTNTQPDIISQNTEVPVPPASHPTLTGLRGFAKVQENGVPAHEATGSSARREMNKAKVKGQESVPSSLLSTQENELLLDLLGRRCVVSTSQTILWESPRLGLRPTRAEEAPPGVQAAGHLGVCVSADAVSQLWSQGLFLKNINRNQI